MTDNNNGDDKQGVGYGRPPKHTQFKPGTSGNPGGRPAQPPNLLDDFLAELSEPAPVPKASRVGARKGGRGRGEKDASAVRMTKLQAITKAEIDAAVDGDPRARKQVLDRFERMTGSKGPVMNVYLDALDSIA